MKRVAICVSAIGTLNDIMNSLAQQYKKASPKPNVFIFDLPRAPLGPEFPYKDFLMILENLKNGTIDSHKYKGVSLTFRSPWVVVFMNHDVPDKWKECLSDDRWAISHIPPLTEEDLEIKRRFDEGKDAEEVAYLPVWD